MPRDRRDKSTDHTDEIAIEFVAAVNGVITLRGLDVPYRELDELESGDGAIRSRTLISLGEYLVELIRDHIAGVDWDIDDVDSFEDDRSTISYGVGEASLDRIEVRHIKTESESVYVRGFND